MAKTKTIDSLIRDNLHDNGWTMHFYVRMLHHALRGLEELSFDHPLHIKTVVLDVTSYNAIIVPSDFLSAVTVEVEDGDRLLPFTADDSINPVYRYNEQGQKIPYPLPERFNQERHLDDVAQSYTSHTNSHGENIGRYFGYNHGKEFAYKYIPERNEIQLTTTVVNKKVVLTYNYDGIQTDALNVIHPYAVEALKLYIHWKMMTYFKPFGNVRVTDMRVARMEYFNAKRILRARFNEMGTEEIIASNRIVHMGLKN